MPVRTQPRNNPDTLRAILGSGFPGYSGFVRVIFTALFILISGIGPVFAQAAAAVTVAPAAVAAAAANTKAANSTAASTPGAKAATTSTTGHSKSLHGKLETIPKSLFLSAQEHDQISDALSDYQVFLAFQKNNNNAAGGVNVNNEPQMERFFTYPQFFMESLVYHSPTDWAVMLNGQRINSKNVSPESAISVIAIDNDRALFRWKPVDMNKVLDTWERIPQAKDSNAENTDTRAANMEFNLPLTDKFPEVPVMVDKEHKIVTFSLRPNQTFSSFTMMALEGKVNPVTVENVSRAGDKVRHLELMAASSFNLLQADNVDDSNSGLNGLMNQMETQNQNKDTQNKGTKP